MGTTRILSKFGLALLLLTAFSAVLAQDPKSLIGKKAPALVVSNWLNSGGKPLELAKLKGKVVVLDFWAFW